MPVAGGRPVLESIASVCDGGLGGGRTAIDGGYMARCDGMWEETRIRGRVVDDVGRRWHIICERLQGGGLDRSIDMGIECLSYGREGVVVREMRVC